MRRLVIVKLGTTFPELVQAFGDFDDWIIKGLDALPVETCSIDFAGGAQLPPARECAGVIISGSHAMVTDGLPWMIELEHWVVNLLEHAVPLLGICFGHQLLALAAGGAVGYHPRGREIGTIPIELTPEGTQDKLLGSLPAVFPAHATHAQSVLRLPGRAVRLAFSEHEPQHAFRIGQNAWGVQFHPEFDAAIMRAYIECQATEISAAGQDITELLAGVDETPFAARVLKNFSRLCALTERAEVAK